MVKIPGGYKKALEISKWLKENGLEHDKDYMWHCIANEHVVAFHFHDEQNESLLLMRWLS